MAGCDGDKGEDMVDAFYRVLAAKAPNIHVPYIVILVSDEAETYRPEMEWIAKELRNRGRRVHVFHPDAVMPFDSICVGIDGDPQAVDVVYRFWELFDLSNVSIAEYLLGQCGSGNAKGGNLLPVVPANACLSRREVEHGFVPSSNFRIFGVSICLGSRMRF